MMPHDTMICPFCGGNILIDAVWDEGDCDTCGAIYTQGELIPPEDEDEEVSQGKTH